MVEHDKAAIIEVLNLYAFALDSHAWELFDRVFTKDIRAEFGPAGAVWSGLENFKRSFDEFHVTLTNQQHSMSGHLVHVDGDQANAFHYGSWLLVRDGAEGGPWWLGSGWYDDVLVRTADGWRIKDRIAKLVHWTGNPLVPVPVPEHHPDMQTNSLAEAVAAGRIRYYEAIKGK